MFNDVLLFYWLGLQGQLADLVVLDYSIISPYNVALFFFLTYTFFIFFYCNARDTNFFLQIFLQIPDVVSDYWQMKK